jgi:hypothetical protein
MLMSAEHNLVNYIKRLTHHLLLNYSLEKLISTAAHCFKIIQRYFIKIC